MKDFINLKLEEGKAQLDSAKVRYAAARKHNDEETAKYAAREIAYWDGWLSAMEAAKEELENKGEV
jgi:hypothetical protein